jgi:lysozyme
MKGLYQPVNNQKNSEILQNNSFGIDVSHFQGSINWPKVLNAKFKKRQLDLVIIKASEGGDYKDPRFTNNWQATNDKVKFLGAYHYFKSGTSIEKQAENFKDCLQEVDFSTNNIWAIDFESNDKNVIAAVLCKELKSFHKSMSDAGFKHGILYTYNHFFHHAIGAAGEDLWDLYELWMAAYSGPDIPDLETFETPIPIGAKKPLIRQFSCNGKISGINGKIDLNLFDYKRLEKFVDQT